MTDRAPSRHPRELTSSIGVWCGVCRCAAHSHLFLAEDDFVRLRSLAFSDSIDPFTIASLCKKVFVKQAKSRQQRRKSEEEEEETKDDGYLVGLKVEELEKELDVRPEVISTILTYLELEGAPLSTGGGSTVREELNTMIGRVGYIRLISEKCPIVAKINFFDAPGTLAANNKLMAAILDHATYVAISRLTHLPAGC